MGILIVLIIIIFIGSLISSKNNINQTNISVNSNDSRTYRLKHIMGVADFDCLTDFIIRVNNKDIWLQNTNTILFENITCINYYTRFINADELNMKNVLLGGVLAGGAGAIVGSQGKKKIVTHTHYFIEVLYNQGDNNKILVLSDNPNNGNKNIYNLFQFFKEIIDNNSFNIVLSKINYENSEMFKQTQDTIAKTNTVLQIDNNILSQIEKLAQLKDNNILTEEEFNIKKQELLSRL